MKKAGSLIALGLAFIAGWYAPPARTEDSSVEYKIKAAYLLNFAKFIEWPSNRFPQPTTPIIFGVLGQDPFGGNLEKTIGNKSVDRRPLRIQHLQETDDLTQCHILFISPTEKRRLPRILESLRGTSVLTVSEMDQFTQFGGMINFFKQENTVRFEINVEASRTAKLKISSKLLQVAKISERLPERGKN
jgi:YfiR/HmsC-like